MKKVSEERTKTAQKVEAVSEALQKVPKHFRYMAGAEVGALIDAIESALEAINDELQGAADGNG